MRYLENTENNFPSRKFFERFDKTDFPGKNCLINNLLFITFDAGVEMGYAFRDILDEPLRKFNEQSDRLIDKSFKEVEELIQTYNRDGFI